MEQTTIYKAIAVALIQNRDGIVNLLQKHGVIVNGNYSDRELLLALLDATRKNARFRQDLATLLSHSVDKNKAHFTGEGMFGFTGENMFRLNGVHPPNGWYGADGRGPAPAAWKSFDGSEAEIISNNYGVGASSTTPSPSPSPTPPKTGSFLSGVFTSANVGNILNSGLGVLSTTLSNKSNKQLADTALQIEHEKTKQAALLAAGGQPSAGITKPGMSTGAKIGIALLITGVVVTGVVLLVRHRRRRSAA